MLCYIMQTPAVIQKIAVSAGDGLFGLHVDCQNVSVIYFSSIQPKAHRQTLVTDLLNLLKEQCSGQNAPPVSASTHTGPADVWG